MNGRKHLIFEYSVFQCVFRRTAAAAAEDPFFDSTHNGNKCYRNSMVGVRECSKNTAMKWATRSEEY